MPAQERQLADAVRAATTTRDVRIAAGALVDLPSSLHQAAPAARYLLVADANTWTVAGERTAGILAAAGLTQAEPVLLAGEPRVKALAETGRALAQTLRERQALPIVVGSGVLNDLCKYAAELAATPYVCVPTAASMDGYAASGAALRDGGFKRTLACAAPVAIVADLDVIASAPSAMAGWGYGDLVGKIVAGADWLLADALGEEPVNAGPFAMVQDNLAIWLGDPAGVRAGRRDALDGLMKGLVVSGLAMQAHGNSRPASGSDHQFAHLWEMEGLAVDGVPVSHGACVGIGCLSMLAAYDWLFRQDLSRLVPSALATQAPSPQTLRAEVAAAFPLPFMAANAEAETLAKTSSPAAVERRLVALQAAWPRLSVALRQRLPSAAEVRRQLEAAGAPVSADAIGIAPSRHAADYARARLIRRRFTLLDVLHDLGWLDRTVAALFDDKGFWAPTRAVA